MSGRSSEALLQQSCDVGCQNRPQTRALQDQGSMRCGPSPITFGFCKFGNRQTIPLLLGGGRVAESCEARRPNRTLFSIDFLARISWPHEPALCWNSPLFSAVQPSTLCEAVSWGSIPFLRSHSQTGQFQQMELSRIFVAVCNPWLPQLSSNCKQIGRQKVMYDIANKFGFRLLHQSVGPIASLSPWKSCV